jgi:hypothetical protein
MNETNKAFLLGNYHRLFNFCTFFTNLDVAGTSHGSLTDLSRCLVEVTGGGHQLEMIASIELADWTEQQL